MYWPEVQVADTFIEVFVRRFRVLASFASYMLEVTLRADVVVLETHNIHMTARKNSSRIAAYWVTNSLRVCLASEKVAPRAKSAAKECL